MAIFLCLLVCGLSMAVAALLRELNKTSDKLEALQDLCSSAYVMAGKVGAPERFLDALVAGANGDFEDLTPEVLESLVPVRLGEFDTKQLYWDLNALGDQRPVNCREVSRGCFGLPPTKS